MRHNILSPILHLVLMTIGFVLIVATGDDDSTSPAPPTPPEPLAITLLEPTPTQFMEGDTVSFAADIKGNPESVRWYSSINGFLSDRGEFTSNRLMVGTHYITVIATTPKETQSSGLKIDVEPRALPLPAISITSPDANSSYGINHTIYFSGKNQNLPAGSEPVWTSSLNGPIGTKWDFLTNNLRKGTHSITLVARNPLTETPVTTPATRIIHVENSPPTVSIINPPNNHSYILGDTVNFIGQASDVEDDDNSLVLLWFSNKNGLLGRGRRLVIKNLDQGDHEIILIATDSHNAQSFDVIRLDIN